MMTFLRIPCFTIVLLLFVGCDLSGPSAGAPFTGSRLLSGMSPTTNTSVFAVEGGYQILSLSGSELRLTTARYDGSLRDQRIADTLLPMDNSVRIIRVQEGRYLVAGRTGGDPAAADTIATLMAALVETNGHVVWMKSYPQYKGPHIDGAFDLQGGEAAVVMNVSPSAGMMTQNVAVLSTVTGEMVRHIDHAQDCITGLAVLTTGELQWTGYRTVQPWVYHYSVRTGDRSFTARRILPVTTTATSVSVLTSTVHHDSTILVMTESFAAGKESLSVAVWRADGSESFRRRMLGWSNNDFDWLNGTAAIVNDRIWVTLNPLLLNTPTVLCLDADGTVVDAQQFHDLSRLTAQFPGDPFGAVVFGPTREKYRLAMIRIP